MLPASISSESIHPSQCRDTPNHDAPRPPLSTAPPPSPPPLSVSLCLCLCLSLSLSLSLSLFRRVSGGSEASFPRHPPPGPPPPLLIPRGPRGQGPDPLRRLGPADWRRIRAGRGLYPGPGLGRPGRPSPTQSQRDAAQPGPQCGLLTGGGMLPGPGRNPVTRTTTT
jgi:hypothetical protein